MLPIFAENSDNCAFKEIECIGKWDVEIQFLL